MDSAPTKTRIAVSATSVLSFEVIAVGLPLLRILQLMQRRTSMVKGAAMPHATNPSHHAAAVSPEMMLLNAVWVPGLVLSAAAMRNAVAHAASKAITVMSQRARRLMRAFWY